MDFSRYQPPGVYIEDVTTPVPSSSSTITPETVAIVGPSRGYRSRSEQLTLVGTTDVDLASKGVDHSTVVVADGSGTTYVEDTDYTLTGTTDDPTATTSIARIDLGSIPDGDTVFVSYQYADEDFFSVKKFDRYEAVRSMFGQPFDESGETLVSPLSLAARIAFENGAPMVALVEVNAADPAAVTADELDDAMELLANDPDIAVVVPLPVGVTSGSLSSVTANLVNHVNKAVTERYYRVAVFGYDPEVTDDPATIAGTIDDSRVMLAYPNRLLYYNGALDQTVEVGGQYLAAAYAGRLVRNGVQHPLTKKRVRSFAGLPSLVINAMSRSQANAWSSSGVAVTEPARGTNSLVVRHGVTTDTSTVFTREMSLVRAGDAMALNLEGAIESSGLIGSPITRDTVFLVKGAVSGALETLKSSGVFQDYTQLEARVVVSDPSLVEVRFEYLPSYPLNYVVISFAVDLQSGALQLTS